MFTDPGWLRKTHIVTERMLERKTVEITCPTKDEYLIHSKECRVGKLNETVDHSGLNGYTASSHLMILMMQMSHTKIKRSSIHSLPGGYTDF